MRERLRQEKVKKVKKIIFLSIFVLLISFVVFLRIEIPRYLHKQNVFRIKRLVVEPAAYQALMSAYIGNVISKNIIFLNLNPIYKSIKKCYFIENCEIEKRLPDTLIIKLKPRIPLFRIVGNKRSVLMDDDGYFLPLEENFNGWTVKGMQIGKIGEKSTDTEKLKILLKIEQWYNYYNIGDLFPVDEISLENLDKIKMIGQTGSVFLYPYQLKQKFQQLQIVLETCKKEDFQFEYIDLRFNQPYVKKKEPGA